MNPETLLKIMSLDAPWSFGLRSTLRTDEQNTGMNTGDLAGDKLPFFCKIGPHDDQIAAVGDDLESCILFCLNNSYNTHI